MVSSSWISWSMFYAAWYPITMPAFAVFLCGKSMNYRNVHVNKVIYKWVALSFNSKIGNCRLGYRYSDTLTQQQNNIYSSLKILFFISFYLKICNVFCSEWCRLFIWFLCFFSFLLLLLSKTFIHIFFVCILSISKRDHNLFLVKKKFVTDLSNWK